MKKSAGILLYQFKEITLYVMLVHPGGPLWANKNIGAWSIPKGEFGEGEDPLNAATREFEEETGTAIDGDFIPLSPVKQNSSKMVHAFALERDFDTSNICSNFFEMEWPPRSGKMISIPEIDKAAWFTEQEARQKIIAGQVKLIDELKRVLGI